MKKRITAVFGFLGQNRKILLSRILVQILFILGFLILYGISFLIREKIGTTLTLAGLFLVTILCFLIMEQWMRRVLPSPTRMFQEWLNNRIDLHTLFARKPSLPKVLIAHLTGILFPLFLFGGITLLLLLQVDHPVFQIYLSYLPFLFILSIYRALCLPVLTLVLCTHRPEDR